VGTYGHGGLYQDQCEYGAEGLRNRKVKPVKKFYFVKGQVPGAAFLLAMGAGIFLPASFKLFAQNTSTRNPGLISYMQLKQEMTGL